MKSSRIERLRELVEASGGPTGFVRTYNRKDGDKPLNESYVSQILNGHRPFGEKSARNMEKRAGLPPGYFDQEIEAPKPEELLEALLTPRQRAILGLLDGLTDEQQDEFFRALQDQKQKNDALLEALLKRRA